MAKAQKIYSDLDFLKNQITNFRVEMLATDPVDLYEGRIWYNTTTKRYKAYQDATVKTLINVTASDVEGLADWLVDNTSINELKPQAADYSAQNFKITDLANPTEDQDAATKFYVDSVAQGLLIKDAVKAATTANIVLSGTKTIDTVALVAGDRVLVKDQTDKTQNGIYVVAAGSWTLASDFDNTPNNEVRGGAYTYVQGGTQAGSGWVINAAGNIVLGTDEINWTQFNGAGQLIGGVCITIDGNTINFNYNTTNFKVVGKNLTINEDGVDTLQIKNSAITTDKLADDSVTVAKLGAVTGTGLQRNGETDVIEIDDTVVTKTGTQTLTNKTLTTPVIATIIDANGNETVSFAATAGAADYVQVGNGTGTVTVGATGDSTNVSLNLVSKGTGTVQVNGDEIVTKTATQTLTNKTLTAPVVDYVAGSNGTEIVKFTAVTNAVNELTITNAIEGGAVTLGVTGTGTNSDLVLTAKGTGQVKVGTDTVVTETATQTLTNKTLTAPVVDKIVNASGKDAITITDVAAAVNGLTVTGGATGTGVTVSATGTDTNIDLVLAAKGTGRVLVGGESLITASTTDTFTNKTIDADNNTISNLEEDNFKVKLADAGKRLVRDATGAVVSEAYKLVGVITGNGVDNDFSFTHNFNTYDTFIEVVSATGDRDTAEVYRYRPDANTASVNFTVAPAVGENYRVLIMKI